MEPQPHIISADAQIYRGGNGNIIIDAGCIIHPKAKIIAEGDCSITIGKYNIIEENVIIRAVPIFNPQSNLKETFNLNIGYCNIFRVGCEVENSNIQNNNYFDYRCKIDSNFIESKVVVSAGYKLPRRIPIKSNTILFDDSCQSTNSAYNEEENLARIKGLYNLLAPILLSNKTITWKNNVAVLKQ